MNSAGDSARQESLRRGNLALVLRTVAAAGQPVSRAEVAAKTGSTRATASSHVEALQRVGLLTQVEPASLPARPSRPGRPSQPMALGGGVGALGMQVGVNGLSLRVISLDGHVRGEIDLAGSLAGTSPGQVLARLADAAQRLLAELHHDLRIVVGSVAVPGLVRDGTLVYAPNLGWEDVPVLELLGRALPALPISLGNEADHAASSIVYASPGCPSDITDFLYVSAEVGVGGALVLDGRVRSGSRGWGGEVGHLCVDPRGPTCPCGSTGCLEQYAGETALLKAARLPRNAGMDDLLRRARAGQRRALDALQAATDALAVALSGALNLVDVSTIVLGGHLAPVVALSGRPLEDGLRSRTLAARWEPPTVLAPRQAPDAAAVGGALLCLDEVITDPVAWFPEL